MMQSPTSPGTKRFASRATSVCSQRYAGSVKSFKSRCDDDEIPSDESEQGGKSPFGLNKRTRIRKPRRADTVKPGPRQPMPSGMSMSWMSAKKSMRTQSVCVPSSSFSNVTTEKNVKKALFPRTSSPNKSPPQIRPGSSGLPGTKSFNNHSNLGLQRGGTSLKSPRRTSAEIIRTSPTSNPDPVPCKTRLPVDWALYSVWHPAWDVIWKCDNGKRPLSQNQYFRKLISEVLAGNMTPGDISATIDLKVVKVQDVKEDSQGKLSIIGALELEASGRPHQKKKKYRHIKWNLSTDLLGRILKYVVSVSDLIVQYKYPPALETGNSKGKLCFIHITPKDGRLVDYFKLSNMGAQVSAYDINYDYYKPNVMKFVPFKLARTKNIAQEPVNVEATATVTVGNKATATSKNIASYVFGSPGPSPTSSPEPASGTRPNVASITDRQQDEEPIDVGSEVIVPQSLVSPLSEQIEEMEISDCEELDVSHNPLPPERAPLNEKNAVDDFNLTSFLARGQFVPGPLRPKVKKPDKPYVYHTLKELSDKLTQAMAEDVSRGFLPAMLVKHQCNTYGIVVEVTNQIRHENAYFVRIADETMASVLLRIHNGSNQSPGPRIELGNIIRVHRVTVQNEWDPGSDDNTIVLSTAAHHNYVIFEPSNEEFQFLYNTCAKTITLSDIDIKRVGELHVYKSKLDETTNEKVPQPTEQSGIAPVVRHEREPPEVERDSIPVVSPFHDSSDGMCDSDLASPCASEISIGEDDVQTNSESMWNESRFQAISNSRSDESFFSATSDVDPPVDNANRSQMRSRTSADSSHKLNTVQSKSSSQNITFILFKDLKITSDPVNLLCQIVSLNEHREGIWCLVLKDMEHTVPSGDFRRPQCSVANPSGFQLAVNIKNGIGLEKRDLLSMLVESQGTDEFYFIPNVKVKGTQPPYTLEIDGNSCEILRYNNLIRFLELDDTFSMTSASSRTANPHEGISSNPVPDPDDDVIVLDEQDEMVEDLNSDGGVASGSILNHPSEAEEDLDDDIFVVEEIPVLRNGGSSESNFVTASHTPSHSPAKIKRQDSPKGHVTPAAAIQNINQVINDAPAAAEEPWTGRLRNKRKPRQHYQSEDSFEC